MLKDSDLFDAASEERVDAFTTVRTDKRGGSVVRWITRTVSSDRNTLVVTVDVTENGGRRRTSTAVLVRQR